MIGALFWVVDCAAAADLTQGPAVGVSGIFTGVFDVIFSGASLAGSSFAAAGLGAIEPRRACRSNSAVANRLDRLTDLKKPMTPNTKATHKAIKSPIPKIISKILLLPELARVFQDYTVRATITQIQAVVLAIPFRPDPLAVGVAVTMGETHRPQALDLDPVGV